MPATTNTLIRAIVRMEADKSSLGQLRQGYANVVRVLRDVEDQAYKVGAAIDQVNLIGSAIQSAGQSILSPLQSLQQAYVSQVGRTEEVSARYLQSVNRLEQAHVRLGRVATQALQPLQDKLVDMTESVTSFIEKHPELLRVAAGVGGVALAAGTALVVSTQIAQSIGQAVSLLQGLKVLGMPVVSRPAATAGAVGLGFGLGLAGTHLVGAATGNRDLQNLSNGEALKRIAIFFQQLAALSPMVISSLVKLEATFEELGLHLERFTAKMVEAMGMWIQRIGALLGDKNAQAAGQFLIDLGKAAEKGIAIKAGQLAENVAKVDDWAKKQAQKNAAAVMAPEAPTAGPAVSGIDQSMLDDFAQHLRQLARDEDAYQVQRQRTIEDHNAAVLSEEQSHLHQMQAAQADFNREQLQAVSEFYRQQRLERQDFDATQKAEDKQHKKETEKAEDDFRDTELKRQRDYNIQRERAEEDHKYALAEAASRLDAIAVLEEQRRYALDKKRAQDDFDREGKDARDSFKKQQKDAQEAYEDQQKAARENFEKQQKQAEDAFKRQQALARANFDYQQQRQEEEYQYQRQVEEQHFQEQLAIEDRRHRDDLARAERYYHDDLAQQIDFKQMTSDEWASYYADLTAQLEAFLNHARDISSSLSSMNGGSSGGTKTGGGGGSTGGGSGGSGGGMDVLPVTRYSGTPWAYFDVLHGDPRTATQGTISHFFSQPEYYGGTQVNKAANDYFASFSRIPMKPTYYQRGGYTGAGGLAVLHGGEFVMNAATTRELEQRLGGRLSNDKLAQGAGSKQTRVELTNHFYDVGSHTPDELEGMVRKVTRDEIIDILENA
jgi:hypothetical protein